MELSILHILKRDKINPQVIAGFGWKPLDNNWRISGTAKIPLKGSGASIDIGVSKTW